MKKSISLVLCLFLIIGLSACSLIRYHGDVSEVEIKNVPSKIYSQEDIDKAIEVILEDFKTWDGCKLTEIYYAGDETVKEEFASYTGEGALERGYEADEMIILMSSFKTDGSDNVGSLNSDAVYDNWNWILVRSNGGQWRHVDHGY